MADIANWTPPLVKEIASQGWTLIGDSEQERAWFASIASSKNPDLHELALKVAYKGLSGHASKIDIVRGVFMCGAGGESPDYLQQPLMFSATGNGTPLDDGGSLPPIAIAPGSILAAAVTKACKGPPLPASQSIAHSPAQPASGKCSIPSADYPVNAIRKGEHGVATVGFDVTMDGHTSNPSVLSSSGSVDLDNAAIAAVTHGTCVAPAGSHLSTAITFNLQH